MNEQKNTSMTSPAMVYGAICGGAIVIYAGILYVFKVPENNMLGLIQWAIMVAGIYIAIRKYRDEILDGCIKYSTALGFGTYTMFFASLFFGVYTYLLYAYIDPGLIESIIEQSELKLIEAGLSEVEIEKTIALTRKFTTPLLLTFTSVLALSLTGFILSLLISFFLKKSKDTFESNLKNL